VRILFIVEDDAERIQFLRIYARNPCDVDIGVRLVYLDIRVQSWSFNSAFGLGNKELVKDLILCLRRVCVLKFDHIWTVGCYAERSVFSGLVPIEFDKQLIIYSFIKSLRDDIKISFISIFQTFSEAIHTEYIFIISRYDCSSAEAVLV
jgi:hypothetical protein